LDTDDSHSIVGKGIKTLSIDNISEKENDKVNDMTSHFQAVDMLKGPIKNRLARKMEWLGMNNTSENHHQSQTLRRQSSAFEVCRLPSAIAAMEKAKRTNFTATAIRRQSSAFEIRNKNNVGKNQESTAMRSWNDQIQDPIYENFDRTNSGITRASLRNKNSSVKDLVKKLEKVDNSLHFNAPTPLLEPINNIRDKRMSVSTSALPYAKSSYSNNSKKITSNTNSACNQFENINTDCLIGETLEKSDTTSDCADSLEALDQFGFGESDGLEQWMDAKEFFDKTPGPTKNFMLLSRPDESILNSGCKRSSIIRIRTEKKGLVSKSVETFTKPCTRASYDHDQIDKQNVRSREKCAYQSMLPPSSIPKTPSEPPSAIRNSTANTPQPSSRRQSAGMGIAGRSSAMPAINSASSKVVTSSPQTSMGVAGAAARRQSIGIRATNQPYNKLESPRQKKLQSTGKGQENMIDNSASHISHLNVSEPPYENCIVAFNGTNFKSNSHTNPNVEISEANRKTKCLTSRHGIVADSSSNCPTSEKEQHALLKRKSKRIEERRYLTIGYTGEKVRSPLKEKQNLIATVQRSKSAQTPTKPTKVQSRLDSGNKNRNRRKQFKDSPYTENMLYSENMSNVRRSRSLRSPNPLLEIPSSLKETIYDVTTPKSDKVKRNLSDRVITPGKGGKKETTPYIKTALFSDGKKRTPIKKSVGISQHSRLQQIIHQEGTSLSSEGSNSLMKQYPANPRVHNYSGASPALRKSPRIVNLH